MARSTTTASCAQILTRRGHVFRTASDTEAIVHLYEERAAAVERLRGMFRARHLGCGDAVVFLARDRFGIKPLYYVATAWVCLRSPS